MLLTRDALLPPEVTFAPVDLKQVEPDGAFQGYASVFGRMDQGRDVVMPGAFRESLAARGPRGVKLLFQHDPNQPIGVWLELREDAAGLYAHGRLMPEVTKAREVLSLMRAGALDGLSIGFRTVTGRTDPRTGIRRLDKIDLWEISIMTFPMLPEARIDAVKRQARHDHMRVTRALRLAAAHIGSSSRKPRLRLSGTQGQRARCSRPWVPDRRNAPSGMTIAPNPAKPKD